MDHVRLKDSGEWVAEELTEMALKNGDAGG